ncbi:MAG: MCE family protein [Saprospiraceae bacterium]|nr:MCE family protein [Saprospiraceae bacterium]
MKALDKTTAQKIKLAIFVIAGLSLFILGVYLIGNQQSMFGSNARIFATFNNINGLKIGNNVRYGGLNVGTVKGIRMVNDSTIVVDLTIKKDALGYIRKNAKAALGTDGLVGNMIINIVPGSEEIGLLNAEDTIHSYRRITTEDMLSTLNVTNENAAMLTADLLKITRAINSGEGTISYLLKDSTMALNLEQSIRYFRQTAASTSKMISHMDDLIVSLNNKNNVIGLLRDSVTANQLKSVVSNLETTGNDMNKLVANLNATVTRAKEGDGAINYLSNDKSLVKKIDTSVNSLDATLHNLNEASIKLNENLEALKHNILFRGYFKKLEKEKEKQLEKEIK